MPLEDRTVGQTFTAPDGTIYRPSMFLTLTLPLLRAGHPRHGRPGRPGDATTTGGRRWTRCTSRSWSTGSGRTCAAAPATRCSTSPPSNPNAASPRTCTPRSAARSPAPLLRQVDQGDLRPGVVAVLRPARLHRPDAARCGTAATTSTRTPGSSCRPGTQALDQLDADPDARPAHVVRFGTQTRHARHHRPLADADRAVRYLTKYLTKVVADTYADPDSRDPAYRGAHRPAARRAALAALLAGCANWLRYGIQPEDAGPGLEPGCCGVEGPRPGEPRPRRPPRPGLPAVVRQDPDRAPRRPRRRRPRSPRRGRHRRPRDRTDGRRRHSAPTGTPRFVWTDTRPDPQHLRPGHPRLHRGTATLARAVRSREGARQPVDNRSATGPATDRPRPARLVSRPHLGLPDNQPALGRRTGGQG